jgi:hypothetical protein
VGPYLSQKKLRFQAIRSENCKFNPFVVAHTGR